MKNFNYIFDYIKYFENIENLSTKDDLLLYYKYKPYYKGLINTCDAEKTKRILTKRFPELIIKIEDNGELFIQGFNKFINNYIPLINNLGYFISTLTLDGHNWIEEFNNNDYILALLLEPKYDIKLDKIPNILYHTSIDKYTKSIEKIGLIPKSKIKLSNHPDRIYVTINLSQAKLFANYHLNNNENPIIWKINTLGLNLTLFKDLNFTPGGYYLLGNIPPSNLEKVNKNIIIND